MSDPLFDEEDESNTPLEAEEREQLIPSYITLRRELNEAGGMVGSFTAGKAKAFEMAQEHCKKFDKTARMTKASKWDDTATFDCV